MPKLFQVGALVGKPQVRVHHLLPPGKVDAITDALQLTSQNEPNIVVCGKAALALGSTSAAEALESSTCSGPVSFQYRQLLEPRSTKPRRWRPFHQNGGLSTHNEFGQAHLQAPTNNVHQRPLCLVLRWLS